MGALSSLLNFSWPSEAIKVFYDKSHYFNVIKAAFNNFL